MYFFPFSFSFFSFLCLGTNFGPSGTPLILTYGPNSPNFNTFTTTGCQNTLGFTSVTCTTATGIGTNQQWKLTIGGQSITSGSGITSSYGVPLITGINPVNNYPTLGGQLITISG